MQYRNAQEAIGNIPLVSQKNIYQLVDSTIWVGDAEDAPAPISQELSVRDLDALAT